MEETINRHWDFRLDDLRIRGIVITRGAIRFWNLPYPVTVAEATGDHPPVWPRVFSH